MEPVWVIFFCIAALVLAGAAVGCCKQWRALRKRRKSLHYDATAGLFVWTGLNGQIQTDKINPDAPGGQWQAGHYGMSSGGNSGFDSNSDAGGFGGGD